MNRYVDVSVLFRLLIILLLGFTSGSVSASTYTTDFENIGGSVFSGGAITEFSIGPAKFTDGMSGVAGIGELYHSGTHAWMVKGGETGLIRFALGEYSVSFYANAFSGSDGNTEIRAFDAGNNLLAGLDVLPSDPFTLFSVTGAIDRIEFRNLDSANTRMNALDDFSVAAVPLPAAVWLFGVSLVGWAGLSRRQAG
jgi:hypothetical protein